MDIRNNYTDLEKEQFNREMSEKLYKMYIIKNKADYCGSIQKYECVINDERGLFKERISTQSKDHIMEQVVYELALLLGVNCCKASCRKSNGVYGSFSRFEVIDIYNIKPFEDIMGVTELEADELLKKAIELNHNNINNFIIKLYQYIIFDYILGQQDRHLENISIYMGNKKNIKLYPLYDNGLCCFASYANDAAIECLDRGFYSSRMGFSEDIYKAICLYRNIIFKDDLRKLIKYNLLNKNRILNIIDKADKYNQMNMKRREATANFIMRQTTDIHKLNLSIGGI
ncbi:MAG: HipA domain-containing protein [Lachnospiraceae bacterium]|nr:HipA domain-containing protein [Lachnospiraceae bacterium]